MRVLMDSFGILIRCSPACMPCPLLVFLLLSHALILALVRFFTTHSLRPHLENMIIQSKWSIVFVRMCGTLPPGLLRLSPYLLLALIASPRESSSTFFPFSLFSVQGLIFPLTIFQIFIQESMPYAIEGLMPHSTKEA